MLITAAMSLSRFGLAQSNELPSESNSAFTRSYYGYVSGGLVHVSRARPDVDLRTAFGLKLKEGVQPGIASGIDYYARNRYNMLPLYGALRTPIGQRIFVHVMGGYILPLKRKNEDYANYVGGKGRGFECLVGAVAGKKALQWHFSVGYKYQQWTEEYTEWWLAYPVVRKNTYHRVCMRVGLGW